MISSKHMKRWLPLLWVVICLLVAFISARWILHHWYDVSDFRKIRFERPWFGLALLSIILIFWRMTWMRFRWIPKIQINSAHLLKNIGFGKKVWFKDLRVGLRIGASTLLVLALMGPQSVLGRDQTQVEGIDIVLNLDVSLSMQAADIEPNRFEATKQVVSQFIQKRPNDRIGSVIFGKEAFTLLPLTTDKQSLQNVISELQLGGIDGEGTAIGNAIGVSLNRLRASDAKSKVIILLTDGESNSGNISPEQATEFASTMGVKIFPILMGVSDEAKVQKGTGFFGLPLWNTQSYPINPELLKNMAEKTGGQYFQVGNRNALEESFHTILDQFEKSEIEEIAPNYVELFPAFLWPAWIGLFLELLFSATLLRRWP